MFNLFGWDTDFVIEYSRGIKLSQKLLAFKLLVKL